MNSKSIWEKDIKIKRFRSLQKDIETGVLVIGAGITGLLCAFELQKRGISVVVVEQNRVGRGITKNTTGFVTAQHETLYQDLIKKFGKKKAKEYLDINLLAVQKYKELGERFDIDFKECPSILYSTISDIKIIKEKEALDSLGYETEFVDSIPLDIPIKKGIKFSSQAKIHPLKLIKSLAEVLDIYENTKIIKLTNNCAYTKNNKIKFNKVIIATHFPFINRVGLYFMKLYQRRSYVVGLPYESVEGTYCSIDPNGLYFRSYGDYLLIGGNDRDTKSKCTRSFEEDMYKLFKNKKFDYSWSNQDTVSLDGVPYIGRYSIFYPSWYVATGFNLWGLTWAMASSIILADQIQKQETISIINPRRSMFNTQLFKNLLNTLLNLVTFKTPRCSHLGCALKYNKIEGTWECPCHGSRYTLDGALLNGPAKNGKHLKKRK